MKLFRIWNIDSPAAKKGRIFMEFNVMNQAKISMVGNEITMCADKGTNLFYSPDERRQCNNFPYYYTTVNGDFMVRCGISVDFHELYDLGALVIFDSERKWIKYAFENSDVGSPAVVSVVTNQTSDDCNGQTISDKQIWLQVCRQGNVFAMHYSINKIDWKLARICRLEMTESINVGISTQCPVGNECTAYYTDLEITENPYTDIRFLKTERR